MHGHLLATLVITALIALIVRVEKSQRPELARSLTLDDLLYEIGVL